MRDKHLFGTSFLAISLIFLSFSYGFSITGNTIGSNSIENPITYYLAILFFIFSVLTFTGKQTLDAIMIPTGTPEADRLRTETAEKAKDRLRPRGWYIISGYYPHGNLKGTRESQDYGIYKHLREHGIIPKEMIVEGQAHDTLENTLYSLKKVKQKAEKEGRTGTLEVGIATYHGHFQRFKDFYEKAVKRGMIGKNDFRLHEVSTPESAEDRKYESSFLRKISHRFKLTTLGRYQGKGKEIKHAQPNPFLKWGYKLRDILR